MTHSTKIYPKHDPRIGKLVLQFLVGVTFGYNLCLGHSRDCWKRLTYEHNSEKGIQHDLGYGVPET